MKNSYASESLTYNVSQEDLNEGMDENGRVNPNLDQVKSNRNSNRNATTYDDDPKFSCFGKPNSIKGKLDQIDAD